MRRGHRAGARRCPRAAGRSCALSPRQAVRRHAEPRRAAHASPGWASVRRVERGSIPLDGMLVTGERGVAVRACFGPGLTGRAISRRLLDGILLRAAVDAAGAQFQDRAVVQGPIVERVRGVMRVVGASIRTADGRTRAPASVGDHRRRWTTIVARLRARSRAAADGARAAGPSAPTTTASSGLGTIGEMHIRAGHYVGIAPLGAGLANICLVTPARAGFDRPDGLHERHVVTDPQLADRFAGARRVSRIAIAGPAGRRRPRGRRPGASSRGRRGRLRRSDDRRRSVARACAAPNWPRSSRSPRSTSPGFDAAAALAERACTDVRAKDARQPRYSAPWSSSEAAVRAAGFGARIAPGVLRPLIRYEADIPSDIESTTGLAAEMREVPWRP